MVSAEEALQVAERSERLAGLNISDENAESTHLHDLANLVRAHGCTDVAQFRSRVRGDATAQKMYMVCAPNADILYAYLSFANVS